MVALDMGYRVVLVGGFQRNYGLRWAGAKRVCLEVGAVALATASIADLASSGGEMGMHRLCM